MNSDWMKRLGIARAWILEAGAVIAVLVWLVRR
jgi:hypothetical protein